MSVHTTFFHCMAMQLWGSSIYSNLPHIQANTVLLLSCHTSVNITSSYYDCWKKIVISHLIAWISLNLYMICALFHCGRMTFRSTVINCRELITVHISLYAYIIKLQLHLLTMFLVIVLSFKCMPSEDGLYEPKHVKAVK